MSAPLRILGMMSGTSLDGIDAALVEFTRDAGTLHAHLVSHVETPMPGALGAALLAALPGDPRGDSLGVETWCRLHTEVGRAYARVAEAVIREHGAVDLVSMHGQTLFHWVDDGVAHGSLQVGEPAWVHEATGAPVLSNLRAADIAAGGQGAPLAATLDALWLADRVPTVALNLGGIANITLVNDAQLVCGDTGPANCLMDALAQRELGEPCDRDARLASSGTVDEHALGLLLADPWFAQPLPRSTGREQFHLDWVDQRLSGHPITTPNLMATLLELTAGSVADAIGRLGRAERVVVSGGGVRNPLLMRRLGELVGLPLVTSDALGLPAQAKEGVLMALLGWLSAHGLPGATATGARGPRVLGTLAPPTPLHVSAAAPVTRLIITRTDTASGIGPAPASAGGELGP